MRHLLLVLGFFCAFHGLGIGQEPVNSLCPAISVAAQPDLIQPGRPATFRAHVDSKGKELKLAYKWLVTTGTIVSGQDAPVMNFLMSESDSVTVTVEVTGFPANCPNTASASSVWCGPPPVVLMDQITGSLAKIPASRFEAAFKRVKQDPTSEMYIIISGPAKSSAAMIREKRNTLLKHLATVFGPHTQRITFLESGNEDDLVSIYLVPPGAEPPRP